MGLVHGTTTGYSHYRCRCDECRAAVREYQRERLAEKRAGTWQPKRQAYEPQVCTGPGCDRVARYVTPEPLCGPHWGQFQRTGVLSPLRKHRFIQDGAKECTRCAQVLPLEAFDRKGTRGHVAAACKPCTSILNRAHRYGMSFDEMKTFMDQPCAGCLTDLSGRMLHVDHDHESGRVRGVLCHNCNSVLTKHMTPTILRRLADYLDA